MKTLSPSPSVASSLQAFRLQLQFSERVLRKNAGDITHAESLRGLEPSGHGLNWVLGHLVAIRSQLMAPLGAQPVWSEAECKPYDRHAAPLADPARARPLAEIWRAFDLTQARLLEAAGRLTEAELSEPLPQDVPESPAKTRGELLAVLGFHDASHVGQTGMIRRLLGKPPANL